MKIIFLDIDGVLNTERFRKILKKQNGGISYYGMEFNFDPRAMRKLKEIIEITDAYLVISSSWREGAEIMDEYWTSMLENLADWEIDGRVIGWTPIIDEGRYVSRGEEIKAWIESHDKIDCFVIIDDREDMAEYTNTNLTLCDAYDGINSEVKDKAIEILMKK